MRTALLVTGLLALGLAAPQGDLTGGQGEAGQGEAVLGEAGLGEVTGDQEDGPAGGEQQAGEGMDAEGEETIMEVEGVQEDKESVDDDSGNEEGGEEEDVEMEEDAEDEDMPSMPVESLGAAVAQLDDKEKKKCERCLKKGFYKRHMDFCNSKCDSMPEDDLAMENVVKDVVENIGDITTTRKPTLSKEEKLRKRCERCSKKGFYKNNKEFCGVKCDHEGTTSIVDMEVDEILKGETVEEGDVSVISEEKKKKKNSPKKKKKKNKTETNIGEKNKKIEKKPEPSKKLGPLENLIKYLIRRNTLHQ